MRSTLGLLRSALRAGKEDSSQQGVLLRVCGGPCIPAVLFLSRGLYDIPPHEPGGESHWDGISVSHRAVPGSPQAKTLGCFPFILLVQNPGVAWGVLTAEQLIRKWVLRSEMRGFLLISLF